MEEYLDLKKQTKLLEDILDKAKTKGKKLPTPDEMLAYDICLPYCNVLLRGLYSVEKEDNGKALTPNVTITTNFGPKTMSEELDITKLNELVDLSSYGGFRMVYRGGILGLGAIFFEGVHNPDLNGLVKTQYQVTLRHCGKGEKQLTDEDKKTYYAFLKYINRELSSSE